MIARLAIVAAVVAEACIAYAVAELFAAGYDGHHHAIPAVAFILIALVAFFLPDVMGFFSLRGLAAAGTMLAVAYVVIYGILRLEFAGDLHLWDESWVREFFQDTPGGRTLAGPVLVSSVLIAVTWARASSRANAEIDLETMPRSLAIGFGLATVLVLAGALTDRTGEIARASAGFYAFGVLSLALSQLSLSGATIGDARAGGITGVLLLGVVGATAVGVVVFGLIFGIVGPVIGPPLGTAIGFVFAVVLTPPAWVISKIMQFLLGGGSFPEVQLGDIRAAADASKSTDDPSTAQRSFAFAGRTLAFLLFLAIVAGPILFYWLTRRKGGRGRQPDAVAGNVQGSVLQDLRSMLRGFGRRRHETGTRVADPVGRLYRDVLEEAEHAGRSREPAETPHEFAPVLSRQFHTPVTDEITRVFVDSRYAGRLAPPEEIERLDETWKREKRNR